MYILKATHKGSWFRSNDAYKEYNTEEQALEMYAEIVNQYPNSIEVEIFKSEKIELSTHILEEALKREEEEYKMKIFMIENGIYEHIEVDLDSKTVRKYHLID